MSSRAHRCLIDDSVRKLRWRGVRPVSLLPFFLVASSTLCFVRRNMCWMAARNSHWARAATARRQGMGSVLEEAVEARPSDDAVRGKLNLEKYLKKQASKVEASLDASLISTTPNNAKIIDAMRYSLMAGGKRIRPIMCLAGYEMIAGGADAEAKADRDAMALAVALEMIHTMSLIHDDLPALDNDDLRRGKPSNHKVYGEDISILAGDALLSESFTHVVTATPKTVPAELVLEAIRRLGNAAGAVGVVGGQVVDIESEANQDASIEDLRWIHLHKTAVLLEAAVVGGAVLAGATQAEIDACSKYARGIGLAFQVTDDILDVTQTSEELGKTAGKDEAAEKTTYVKLLGLEGAKQEALRLKTQAIEALAPFGSRAAPLLAIADYIVKRTN